MLMCISSFPWENQLFLFFTVLWSALWKTEEYDYLLIIHLWCERSANPCPWCSCAFCYSNIPSHFGLVCSLNFFMVQSVFVSWQKSPERLRFFDTWRFQVSRLNCDWFSFFSIHPIFCCFVSFKLKPVFLFTPGEHRWPLVSDSFIFD